MRIKGWMVNRYVHTYTRIVGLAYTIFLILLIFLCCLYSYVAYILMSVELCYVMIIIF